MKLGCALAAGIVGVLIAISVLVAAGIGGWVYSQKDELKEQGKASIEEGRAAGRSLDAAGCEELAFRRGKDCSGLVCGVATGVFLGGCLQEAAGTPGYCEEVPSSDDLLGLVTWRLKWCATHGRESNDPVCTSTSTSKQGHCRHRVDAPGVGGSEDPDGGEEAGTPQGAASPE